MTKKILWCLIFLSLSFGLEARIKTAEWVKPLHQFQDSFAKQMKKMYGINCIGTGGGGCSGFESVGLSFRVDRKLSLEEARTLYVQIAELLIENINKNEKLTFYMREKPFTFKNIDLSLIFSNSSGYWYRDEFISGINNNEGKMFYEKMVDGCPRFNRVHTETYEEAKNIVYSSHETR